MKKSLTSFALSLRAQLLSGGMSFRKYITEETYINGKPFSFNGHEYQDYTLKLVEDNPGCTFIISKCSQIGLSELFNRVILSIMAVVPGTSAIVSFPSKTFAQEVFKTRFTPVIDESPSLSALISSDVDSASVKAFKNGSIAYALGGNLSSKGTLLNRPVSVIFNDELDRQDMDVVTGYRSRMTHTPPDKRLIIRISTPTVQGIGINAEMEEARFVHTPWIGCPNPECNHEFIGDYYKHVRLPGYDENLLYLTKAKAASLDLSSAYLECPECKKPIDGKDKLTIWKVEENLLGTRKKIGVNLDPFVAMSFISMPDLIESSLEYTSHVEFLNQGLGKVADKKDSTIDTSKLQFIHKQDPVGMNIFGLDLGKMNYFMRGILGYDTSIHVAEVIPVQLADLQEFLDDQFKRYVYACGVTDAQPYTDLIYKNVKKYPRLFSAIYVDVPNPKPAVFTLTMVDKFGELVRQIAINKQMAMSNLASDLEHFYSFEPGMHDSLIRQHYSDMRKVRDYRTDEVKYMWVKSARGQDHLWHASVYLSMAAKLAQLNLSNITQIPVTISKINPEARRLANAR